MRFEPRMGFVTDVNSAVPRVLEANTVAMTTSFLTPTYFVLIPTSLPPMVFLQQVYAGDDNSAFKHTTNV